MTGSDFTFDDFLPTPQTSAPSGAVAPSQPRGGATPAPQSSNPLSFFDDPKYQTTGQKALVIGAKVLNTAGKALQPLFAPQQILFGAIGAATDLIRGDTRQAIATWNRGLGAAGDYATYGLTAKQLGNKTDERDKSIFGYDLLVKMGAPEWMARPVGVVADFVVDVPLVGTLSRAAGISRALDLSTSIERAASQNMARAFRDPLTGNWDTPAIRKFATRVIAAPLSTAPIRDILTGLPVGYRESLAQRAAGIIEGGRSVTLMGKEYRVGGGRSSAIQGGRAAGRQDVLGPTSAQWLISSGGQVRGLPTMGGALGPNAIADLKAGKVTGTGRAAELERELFIRDSEVGKVSIHAGEVERRYKEVTDSLAPSARDDFNKIAYRILDWQDPAQLRLGLQQLDTFAASTGNPAFKAQALEAIHSAATLDTYMGLLKFKTNTLGLDKASGFYQGLRRFERQAFGQPKTENPLSYTIARRAINARTGGMPVVIPEQAMHFRRSYGLQFRPEDIVDQVRANALPPSIMDINEGKLAATLESTLMRRFTAQPYTMPQLAAARAANSSRAAQLATDFKAQWTNPNINERTAMSTFLTNQNIPNDEIIDILQDIGNAWHQNGVTYRPPSKEVERIMRDMAEETRMITGAGINGVDMATNRASLASRTDLPEWMRESMQQNFDIVELLQDSVRAGVKQFKHRTTVQETFNFLKSEDAILSKADFDNLPVQHQNWRRVSPDLAARLKAVDGEGMWEDLPFKGEEYIPAAYHELLVGFTHMNNEPIKNAMLKHLLTAWKAHKVASPAGIARDTATNYRLASDMGINPVDMTRAIAAALTLRNSAMVRGAGALDETAKVTYRGTDVSWREAIDHGGGFVHGTFVAAEVDDAYRALRENVANARGDGFQGMSAAILDFADTMKKRREELAASGNPLARAQGVAETGVAAVADVVTGLGGPITKKLGDLKGAIDTVFKLGVFIHMRSLGKPAEEAARYADEMFFNYANQPVMVDFLRKSGISPFAAFQFMSTGRFVRTLYDNPYAVSRWYKTPASITSGDERTNGELQYTAPDYMRKQLWVPLPGRDSQGRSMFFNLASVMPESSVFSMTGTDAVSQWIPPYIELYTQLLTGKGYQGMPIYNGGGSLNDILQSGNKEEAARGIVKGLHQFGASPWSPGSPMADRLSKAIVAAAVPEDQIMHSPIVQAILKNSAQGVFAAPLSPGAVAPQRTGAAAPVDLLPAFGRFFGFTTAPVTGYSDKPGSARGNMQGAKATIGDLKYQMYNEIKNAGADPDAVQEIVARYLPLIMKQTDQIGPQQQFMDQYAPTYQMETPR